MEPLENARGQGYRLRIARRVSTLLDYTVGPVIVLMHLWVADRLAKKKQASRHTS
jgi:hypothetical protein